MRRFARIAALPIMLILGLALGLGLKAVLSAPKNDDVCHGQGSLERDITVASDGGKVYHVCTKPGQRVIFDAVTGTPVDQTIYDDQIAAYYAQNPNQNPRLIADATARADLAVNGFVKVDLPTPEAAKDCPDTTVRTSYPQIGVSFCVPDGWKVVEDDAGGVAIGNGRVLVGAHPSALKDTLGTKCASPQEVRIAAGALKVCAFPMDAEGGQGHGFVYPSGREGGLSTYAGVTPEERALAFQIAYTMAEEPR